MTKHFAQSPNSQRQTSFLNWIFAAALVFMFCAGSAPCQPLSEDAGKAIPNPIVTQLAAIESLTDTSITTLPDNSPLLKIAYAQLFLRSYSTQPNWVQVVNHDLERRKESAVPLLLDLFRENPESSFRANLLNKLSTNHPELPKEPFLSAARLLWDEKRYAVEPRTCYAIARFFAAFGNATDRRILLEMNSHPNKAVSFAIEPDIRYFDKRITTGVSPSAPKSALSKPPNSIPHLSPPLANDSALETQKKNLSNGVWLAWILVAVVAISLLWLVLKKRRKRGQAT